MLSSQPQETRGEQPHSRGGVRGSQSLEEGGGRAWNTSRLGAPRRNGLERGALRLRDVGQSG